MNQKAAVTKDINARHLKILEGLCKLPGNRECADCKSRAPRWASVNLGIFICMQCSGIHRSLGVHISKVRSATLDTWLPEQVAFVQSMGNEKSNAYWEAELPSNYDKVNIENFIRAKYVEKRWVSKDGKQKLNLRADHALSTDSRPRTSDGHGESNNHGPLYRERKNGDHSRRLTKRSPMRRHSVDDQNSEMSSSTSCSARSSVTSEPHTASTQSKQQDHKHNIPDVTEAKPAIPGSSNPPSQVQKVDYATDLFKILSGGDSLQTTVTDTWVNFETEEESLPSVSHIKKESDMKMSPDSERKNLSEVSKSSLSLVPFSAKENRQEVKNFDNEEPFAAKEIQVGVKNETACQKQQANNSVEEESKSVHHERLAMLAADEFMPFEAKPALSNGHMMRVDLQPSSSNNTIVDEPKHSNGRHSNNVQQQQQQWSSGQMSHWNGQQGRQSNGGMMTMHKGAAVLNENGWSANSSSQLNAMSSKNNGRPYNVAGGGAAAVVNGNGGVMGGARMKSPPNPPPLVSKSGMLPVSGYDYDFSSLTQGYFKR